MVRMECDILSLGSLLKKKWWWQTFQFTRNGKRDRRLRFWKSELDIGIFEFVEPNEKHATSVLGNSKVDSIEFSLEELEAGTREQALDCSVFLLVLCRRDTFYIFENEKIEIIFLIESAK